MHARRLNGTLRRTLVYSLALALLSALAFVALGTTQVYAATTITVNSTADVISNDGSCTLREAIIAVNKQTASGGLTGECPAGTGNDTIIVPAGAYTITIGGVLENQSLTGDYDITRSVTIQGAGRLCASPPNSQCTIINANSVDRVFEITTTVQVTLSQMEIEGGHEASGYGGGGILNNGALALNDLLIISNNTNASGGGLFNMSGATAVLNRVSFGNNSAGAKGGAIANLSAITLTNVAMTFGTAGHGGGLSNDSRAVLTDSTLGSNTSTDATDGGGGIWNQGNLTLNRVTINNNEAQQWNGGGIYNLSLMVITNTTFSSNKATVGKGGAIYSLTFADASLAYVTLGDNTAVSGGGIYRDTASLHNGLVNLQSSIVYSSTNGNCAGSAVTSLGYNLDNANTCAFTATGDMTNTNPSLGALASNGGATQTRAISSSSPAFNKIPIGVNGCGTSLAIDQRGYARVGPCDIGAFEYVLRLFLPLITK
jgi:CSLREA domain-containing protein